MFSVVFTFFRSLSLSHLERSLYSLSKQTRMGDDLLVYCNDVEFPSPEVVGVVEKYFSLESGSGVRMVWDRHYDPSRRNASYCQNTAIKLAKHDTFIFTKADCIYANDFCEKLLAQKTSNPMEFIAPWMYQMMYFSQSGKPHDQVDHAADLEPLNWREDVRRLNQNTVNGQLHHHAAIDAPSFCTTKQAMDRAGWYDEHITQWSYWQIDLQSNMAKRGIEIKVIPEVLAWHMAHGLSPEEGDRDLQKAHAHWLASPRRQDPNFQ